MNHLFTFIYIIFNIINSIFSIMHIERYYLIRFTGESTVFFSYDPLSRPAAEMNQLAE